MTFVSYAQNFEDVLLRRAFRDVRQGFYIDVGAAHPDVDSVTRAFYDRGWRGINIEPVAELHARLRAARPRDVNLRVVAGAAGGEATIHVIAGTGLSTVDADLAAAHRAAELDVRAEKVAVATVAEIWREHAPDEVHFLKVDVEGAEAAVLEGADLASLRPHVVLVEATAPGGTDESHAAWEPALLGRGYRFLWFDGLNRFYAAEERHAALEPHFRVPVCVFDDFLRAADTEWTRRVTEAEMRTTEARVQAGDLLEQAMTAEAAASAAAARAREAEARAHSADHRALAADHRALAADQRAAAADQRAERAELRAAQETQRVLTAQQELKALHGSTSWRLTAPMRGAMEAASAFRGRRARRRPDANGQAPTAEALPARRPPDAAAPALPPPPAGRAPLRAVHQFHSGSAVGDAITNAMLLIRSRLRAMGYRSEIYVEHRDPELASELLDSADLPRHDGYVLILHHSMGFDAYERILSLAAPKVLMYHNITPPELLADQPHLERYARLGREQLAGLRGRVAAALADSAYNALELRSLGFDDPRPCTLLFDLDDLTRRHDGPRARGASHPFTILFVGRVIASKAQLDLVEAFARFRALDPRPSRLVLVGRVDDVSQGYADAVRGRADALGVGADVVLTGLVDDGELVGWYASADLYLSLSRHEGFGVPLVEAAAAGVPVLAWPAGAVAFTVGAPAGLLAERDPDAVAARVAELAADPQARRDLARAQGEAARRFALPAQLPALAGALSRAGAASPRDPDAREAMLRNMRFTIAGHVNKTYSLAAINRTLARRLDDARPGRVRLLPIEGQPTGLLDDVPAEERARVEALAARPAHDSGPVAVISQHYPVHVPEDAGDALLAYVFWEESRLPPDTVATLNASFRGVLAPSEFVAKALVDSGVSAPVRTVGFAPDLPPSSVGRPEERSVFTFLHVSSAFPRKGVDVLLAAYARAFRASDPVRLVVKTFPNPHNDAAARVDALRAADPEAPRVELVDADLDAAGMAALLRDADAMVLPTRGEGFNLPAAEALAAGVPLIVTGHGGHMDFCDAGNARLVAFRLAPSRSHLATPASLWAEPDADDLALAMSEAARDRAAAEARAQRGREAAALAFAPAAFVARVEAAAVDALLRPAPGRFRLCVVSSWGVRCGVAEYARALVDGMRAADAELDVTVLADSRFDGSGGAEGAVRAVWTLGAADNAGRLRSAVAQADPDAVLVQHQPGLLGWGALGAALRALASPHRVLAVALHNTAHLLDVEPAERAVALSGLRAACRVVVHTPADVERLRVLGLEADVVLIPQGAPEPLAPRPERAPQRHETLVIGGCGFLLPGKGLPALAAAAGLLKPRWPRIRLRLVCADYGNEDSRSEAARVREAARAGGLDGALELSTDFLPYDDARRRLSGCDVIALPYPESKEASSAALRMALSSGPCVAVTPIALFDEAEDAVRRLPGASAAEIAEGLGALLDDRAGREATRRAARSWVEARRWDATAARTLGMLKGLAASRLDA